MLRALFLALLGLLLLPLALAGLAGSAIAGVRRLIRRLVRAFGGGVGGGVAAGLLATLDPRFSALGTGVAVGGALFLLILLLWPEPRRKAATASVPNTVRGVDPDEEPALADAWRTVSTEAPLAMRRRIAAAREASGRFLRLADASPLDPDAIEWAVFVRRHVPELIERWQAEARHMPPARRAHRAEQLVQSLEQIAGEAEARSERLATSATEAFELSRRHVALRTGRDDPLTPE